MSTPLEEGSVHSAGEAVTGRPLRELRISTAATLKDLQEDYAFFNHSILLEYGRLTQDPVQDIVNRAEKLIEPTIMDFSYPVLDMPWPWGYRLIAVDRSDWEWFSSMLKSVAALDRQTGRLVRSFPQQIQVLDRLDLDKRVVAPAVPPVVEITAFSADATDGFWIWEAGRVVRKPPRPETLALHKQIIERT